jgi:hypothetical protein
MYTLFQRRGRLKNVTNIHNFKREEILEEKTKKKKRPIIPLENVVGELRQFVH